MNKLFTEIIHYCFQMTSVERILQYTHLDQEAPDETSVQLPLGWPSSGRLTLSRVTMAYDEDSRPALKNLFLDIQDKEKVCCSHQFLIYTDCFTKGCAMCYHIYVTMHVKNP